MAQSNASSTTGTPKGGVSASPTGKLSVMTLAIMNIVAVVSLRGLPAEAEYGLSSIFYYVFAAIVFLIPVSLVAAELAAAWPQKGGVYRWVGEAFGARLGFLSIWLLWIESTIWFPTVLTFAAVSLAFIGPNQTWDEAFSANKWYVLVVCLVVYWGATLINLRGMSAGAALSKWGGMIGTIIPAGILIVFGVAWLVMGRPIQMPIAAKDLSAAAWLRKNAPASGMASDGLLVGKRTSARISSGPLPTAHTNLVPPASIPPQSSISILTFLAGFDNSVVQVYHMQTRASSGRWPNQGNPLNPTNQGSDAPPTPAHLSARRPAPTVHPPALRAA